MKRLLSVILAFILIFTCGMFAACDEYNEQEDITVTVSFDLNFEDAPDGPSSKEVTVNSKYGLLTSPRREGYNFAGWYLSDGGEGEAVTSGTAVTVDSDHTLYAKWEAVQPVTARFYDDGVLVFSADVETGKMYGTEGVPSENPNIKIIEGITHDFKYWYYQDENDEHIIVDAYSMVMFDEDHEIYAYYAPFKSLYNFQNPNEDKTYFNRGRLFAITEDGGDGSLSSVTYDEEENAIKVTPLQQNVVKLYCIMDVDLKEHWKVTFSLQTVCAPQDENQAVGYGLTVKGGGPSEIHLEASEKNQNIVNNGQLTVSGYTRRPKEYQVLLIIDIGNISNRTALEFYLKQVEIEPYPEPLKYDFANPYNKKIIRDIDQYAETSDGSGSFTKCSYNEVKKAFKVTAAKATVTKLFLHVEWFINDIWIYADKRITWEVEVDTGGAAGANITLQIQCKNTNKASDEVFNLTEPQTIAFASGVYTVTGDLTEDANRVILLIDVSALDNPTLASFYIKSLSIDSL